MMNVFTTRSLGGSFAKTNPMRVLSLAALPFILLLHPAKSQAGAEAAVME